MTFAINLQNNLNNFGIYYEKHVIFSKNILFAQIDKILLCNTS